MAGSYRGHRRLRPSEPPATGSSLAVTARELRARPLSVCDQPLPTSSEAPPASGKSLPSSEAPGECPPWPLPPPNPHVTLSFLFSRTRSMSICTRAHLLNCELPGGLGLLVHLRVTCCQDVLRKTFSHALTYVTTRAGLKDAAVHAVSRPRKDQDSLILLARGACSGDIRGDRKRNCDSRGLGRGNEEPFSGDRVSVSRYGTGLETRCSTT